MSCPVPHRNRRKIDVIENISNTTEIKKDENITPRLCPIRKIHHNDLEQDFTTKGVPGSLECPFAQMQTSSPAMNNKVLADPIAAEFHADRLSELSGTASAQAGNKCPIRFLDQHSPEEVAKYFENHKHEIPRSHEICIKRYQQNENRIRQLDAKYGNLANMLQGLGTKHQQYLPEDEYPPEAETGPVQATKIDNWAEKITPDVPVPEDIQTPRRTPSDEQRQGHFERSLREIRVGESPTRPWGISVPLATKPTASAAAADPDVEPMDLSNEQPVQGTELPAYARNLPECSNEQACIETSSQQHKRYTETHKHKIDSAARQMVFNGPVFFGYSPEQVNTLLQSGNLGPPLARSK